MPHTAPFARVRYGAPLHGVINRRAGGSSHDGVDGGKDWMGQEGISLSGNSIPLRLGAVAVYLPRRMIMTLGSSESCQPLMSLYHGLLGGGRRCCRQG